ncbi:MAG: M6 family metalloprotease domain-containing protein, partial [Acidobacteria bacterium]
EGWSDKIVVSNLEGAKSSCAGFSEADSIYVNFAVVNSGEMPGWFRVELLVDGKTVTTVSLSGTIAPNEFFSTVSGYRLDLLSAGEHTITVLCDPLKEVTESNENDNGYSIAIQVRPGGSPNLTPYQPWGWSDKIVVSTHTGTSQDSETLSVTDNLYVDWAMINNGVSAVAWFYVNELYVDGLLVETWECNPLETGLTGSDEDFWLGRLAAGWHTITIKLDVNNSIAEYSERDNEYTKTIYVTGGGGGAPNLTPYQPPGWSDKIVVSTVTGANTDTSLSTSYILYADWAVINNGTVPTASPFCVQLYLDGALLETWNRTEPQGPNHVFNVNDFAIGTLNAGTHTLRLRVDCGNSVSESNENDNEYSKTFSVAPSGVGLPNLTPYPHPGWSDSIVVSTGTGTSTDSPAFCSGVPLYIDCAVTNTGTAATATRFYTELYVDGVLKQSWYEDPAFEVSERSYEEDYAIGPFSAGSHTIRIKTDSTSAISESDETDNEYIRTILVVDCGGLRPNVTPYQPSGWSDKLVVSTAPGTHADGSPLCSTATLYVDWAVINNGTAPTGARFYTEFYLDGVLQQTWHKDPPLQINDHTYVEDFAIGPLSAGSHSIRILTDSSSALTESNETDNEYTRTIAVEPCGGGLPNLTPHQPSGWGDKIVVSNVTGTQSDSSSLLAGQTLYVDWAVINSGTAATSSTFYTELYVDGALRQSWYTHPPLNVGDHSPISDYSIGTFSSGTHSLRIRTDSGGAITESSEADNEYTRTFTVGEPPWQTRHVLVLMVDFPDKAGTATPQSFRNLLFALKPPTPATGSLRDYFREVSYGRLDLTGDVNPGVNGWIRLPQTSAYYAAGCFGIDEGTGCPGYPRNAQKMTEDAVAAAAAAGVNFGMYDRDSDGDVDALFIVHAGRGGEFSNNPNDIWSHFWETRTAVNTGSVNQAGLAVYVSEYNAQAEFINASGDMTIGPFAHEHGHNLGLPDLYDLGFDSHGAGVWSLMSAGQWNGVWGDSPAHPDAWCKWRMGWLTPTPVTSTLTNEAISQAETEADVYQLLSGDAQTGSGQYFLVENRQKEGFDRGLPGSGLLVWHIDETRADNDYQWYPGCSNCDGRYKVALEQADGRWDLEKKSNFGDPSDPFPGYCAGQPCRRSLDVSTTPNSNLNSGAPSGVSISAISDPFSTMTATLSVAAAPCVPPQPPVISAPGNAPVGTDYSISWTGTSSENLYLIQESTSTSFSGAASWVVNGTSRSFNHAGAGKYYYRVLARVHCSGAVTDSPWSNVASTAIRPADTLVLRDSRFTVRVNWRTGQGSSGQGVAVRASNDSGYFWFFGPDNVELFVKLLDGRGVNGYFWFFYGALTNIEYTLTVTDTQTGNVRTYFNPQGVQAGGHDISAFPGSGSPSSLFSADLEGLLDLGPAFYARDRFKIELTWRTPGGATGSGTAVPLTSDSGYFWFFDSSNVELVVKIVDGRGANSHFWFFYGSLTDIQFTITVTDMTTGASRSYQGQQGVQQSGYDLNAF